jgi:hypothetical protein
MLATPPTPSPQHTCTQHAHCMKSERMGRRIACICFVRVCVCAFGATLDFHPSHIACGRHSVECFLLVDNRNPLETRWLAVDAMSTGELVELLDFYNACVAQEVWDGGSFEIQFTDEFVQTVESGDLGWEATPDFKHDLSNLELLPGTWLQIGEWPVDSPCRAALYKQMSIGSGTNRGGLFWFMNQTGWACSDSLEVRDSKDGHEVPAELSIAFGYKCYGKRGGRDTSLYPSEVHWPDWSKNSTDGIVSAWTGHGMSEEVKAFKEELDASQAQRAAEVQAQRAAEEADAAPGCEGKLAQRYLKFLQTVPSTSHLPADVLADVHLQHSAIFAYMSSRFLRCKIDSLGAQLRRQYPEVEEIVKMLPRLPFV